MSFSLRSMCLLCVATYLLLSLLCPVCSACNIGSLLRVRMSDIGSRQAPPKTNAAFLLLLRLQLTPDKT